MYENVKKFFDLYDSDLELRRRVRLAEEQYPGPLEIRTTVASHTLLPEADALGLPSTLMGLKNYETKLKPQRSRDVALCDEKLAMPLEDHSYWLIDHGWEFARPEWEDSRQNG